MSELTESKREGVIGKEDERMGEAENEGHLGQASPSHTLKPSFTHALEHSHTQQLWARLIVEEFVRQGVGLFVLASGSRSTPLTVAVAENSRANHLIHFDERGGAFVALGFARATGRPAVWITTSGTAVANGLPAVIEADADGVPLIMMTADRPPELRETGANQTIRQPGIFGPYVRWEFDLPVPDPSIDPSFVLTTAGLAVHRSLSPTGPVHLNCMFREPLTPEGDGAEAAAAYSGLADWQSSERPYTRYPVSSPSVSAEEIEALATRLENIERGLVLLGKSDDPSLAGAASRLATVLGWPLLADVASGGRLGGTSAVHHDLVTTAKRFGEAYPAEAILHLGGRITSKRLQRYFEGTTPAIYVVVRPDPGRLDPSHIVTDRVQADVGWFCKAISEEFVPSSRSSAWMQAWATASAAAEDVVERSLNDDDISEPSIARAISKATPDGHGLVVASSMPIRDLDAFAVANGPVLHVTANRGASGIDGTLATTAGFARGLDRPTTLFIGDLALLHDLNSLALLRNGPPVTVVVINNDGGGIFSFLPIVEQKDVFEPFFGTPHGYGFEDAARMFGLRYHQPITMAEFNVAYMEAITCEVSSLIEVRTDRDENVGLHSALMASVVAAIESTMKL